MNKENVFDGCLLTISTTYSLANIEQILGIIILIIQILWISSRLTIKIIEKHREKKSLSEFIKSIEPSDINILKEENEDGSTKDKK